MCMFTCDCSNFARRSFRRMNQAGLILGLAMIVVAIVAHFVEDVGQFVNSNIIIGSAILGLIIVVLSILALCAATKINNDKRCKLKIYMVLLFLLIAAQSTLVVLAIVKESHLQDFLELQWMEFEPNDRKAFMDQFKCGEASAEPMDCGVNFDEASCFDDCYDTFKTSYAGVATIVMIVAICVLVYQITLFVMGIGVICEPEQHMYRKEKQCGEYYRLCE